MKKILLTALALVAGAQLYANVQVETNSSGAVAVSTEECSRVQGPFFKGRCAEEVVGRCETKHEIVCPACPSVQIPACPDIQCPSCPVCPEFECVATAKKLCPAVKMCDICHKPWHKCGGCQQHRHGHKHHGRNVETVETVETVVEAPMQKAPAKKAMAPKTSAKSSMNK